VFSGCSSCPQAHEEMNVTPYALCFIAGLFTGLYTGNLKFRKVVNDGLKALMSKASKMNVGKGFK
jgi:hypothetical protein